MAEHANRIHFVAGEQVVVRRSARRTRTVSAHREGGRIVDAPAHPPPRRRTLARRHELTHLVEPDNTDRFWRLVGMFPRVEEAKGYLTGWADAMAARLDSAEPGPGDIDECGD